MRGVAWKLTILASLALISCAFFRYISGPSSRTALLDDSQTLAEPVPKTSQATRIRSVVTVSRRQRSRRQRVVPVSPRGATRPTLSGRSGNVSTLHDLIDVPLTTVGEKLRGGTVLFRGLNSVCSNTNDWRHWLPVYLHRFTGADVVVWNTLQKKLCRHCPSTRENRGVRACQSVLGSKRVDMLVVVGAGRYSRNYKGSKCSRGSGSAGEDTSESDAPSQDIQPADISSDEEGQLSEAQSQAAPPSAGSTCLKQFPFMKRVIRTRWVNRRTYKVHFPISTLNALNDGNVFGFNKVIGDETFLKPIGLDTAENLKPCITGEKKKTLLYIARYLPSKGLIPFLREINPELLKDYTVHVFGEMNSQSLKDSAMKTAKARHLPVVFHEEVSKEQLLGNLCSASGVILYAERDKNPRVAYEGLYVGAPVFISDSSGLPASFLTQPFIKTTHFGDGNLNRDFEDYLSNMVERPAQMATAIQAYITGELHPDSVYLGICREMGICA